MSNAMKPIDPQVLATLLASRHVATAEPGLELQARLWQLLLPMPEAGDELSVSAANSGSATAPSRDGDQDQRERDPTGDITAAAYVLASAIQQLSLQRLADGTRTTELRERPGEHAFNVQIEARDAESGTASATVWNPELGDVGLELEWANGAVRVIATADTAQSARVLQEGQALLAARLLQQGVALEALEVVVRKRPSKHGGRGRGRQHPDGKREHAQEREDARERES
jgi:Flagellar hook-length control protein FliK